MFEIIENAKYNSLEVKFDGKPGEAVRDALKLHRFRWNHKTGLWYGYADKEELAEALAAAEQNSAKIVPLNSAKNYAGENRAKPVPDDLKKIIRAEYSKAWNSQKMIDHCCSQVSRAIRLDGEQILTIKKRKIETSFCFGESGYDYDDAARMARHAATSEEYFKSENLAELNSIIQALEGNGEGYYTNGQFYIEQESYTGSESLKLCHIVFYKYSRLYELTDSEKERIRLPYDFELEAITEAYKAERAAFENRLDNYLKRYGMEKIKTWTYWRDA